MIRSRSEIYELAEHVARELSEACRTYKGQKWGSSADGGEKAVPFEVDIPSLRGVVLDTVQSGSSSDSSFDSIVYGVEHSTLQRRSRLTYLFHFELGISSDGRVFTGKAVIQEKNFDWQM
jgi:hypothetical protein